MDLIKEIRLYYRISFASSGEESHGTPIGCLVWSKIIFANKMRQLWLLLKKSSILLLQTSFR